MAAMLSAVSCRSESAAGASTSASFSITLCRPADVSSFMRSTVVIPEHFCRLLSDELPPVPNAYESSFCPAGLKE